MGWDRVGWDTIVCVGWRGVRGLDLVVSTVMSVLYIWIVGFDSMPGERYVLVPGFSRPVSYLGADCCRRPLMSLLPSSVVTLYSRYPATHGRTHASLHPLSPCVSVILHTYCAERVYLSAVGSLDSEISLPRSRPAPILHVLPPPLRQHSSGASSHARTHARTRARMHARTHACGGACACPHAGMCTKYCMSS